MTPLGGARVTQSLYLVIGGRLKQIGSAELADPTKLDIVGVFPSRNEALEAWRSKALRTVDDCLMRYFVLPLHELIDRA
jgi:hypothetical protein